MVEGGLLLCNDRIVIPGSLHKEMLQRIHSEGHLCLNKCRKEPRIQYGGPNLGPDLKWWIDNCSFCLQNSRQQRAEPLRPMVLPRKAMVENRSRSLFL